MIKISFNEGWTVGPNSGFFNMAPDQLPEQVTLPHDTMISKLRSATAVSGGKKDIFLMELMIM